VCSIDFRDSEPDLYLTGFSDFLNIFLKPAEKKLPASRDKTDKIVDTYDFRQTEFRFFFFCRYIIQK